jgi:hypothetical protein
MRGSFTAPKSGTGKGPAPRTTTQARKPGAADEAGRFLVQDHLGDTLRPEMTAMVITNSM